MLNVNTTKITIVDETRECLSTTELIGIYAVVTVLFCLVLQHNQQTSWSITITLPYDMISGAEDTLKRYDKMFTMRSKAATFVYRIRISNKNRRKNWNCTQ